MDIKEITLPTQLLNLPLPYGETDFIRRRKQLKTLSYEAHEIKTALNVLERCLDTLSLLSPLKESGDLIPDSLMEYWGFTAQSLADDIPTLDELRLLKIEAKLKEYGIGSPSPDLIIDVAEYWVWWVVSSIEKATLNWVEDALMKNRDLILISRFLLIAKRYWQKIEPRFAQSLLSTSAMIGRQKALPLLESVEQNPLASEEVKETVRNYHRYVLKHPDKWLPDDAKEEMPVPKRTPQIVLQPTFG